MFFAFQKTERQSVCSDITFSLQAKTWVDKNLYGFLYSWKLDVIFWLSKSICEIIKKNSIIEHITPERSRFGSFDDSINTRRSKFRNLNLNPIREASNLEI